MTSDHVVCKKREKETNEKDLPCVGWDYDLQTNQQISETKKKTKDIYNMV